MAIMQEYDPRNDAASFGKLSLPKAQQPAVGSAMEALQAARNLAERVSIVVDQFCGSVPQAVEPKSPSIPAGSLFHELRGASRAATEAIDAAQRQLDRLSAEVG